VKIMLRKYAGGLEPLRFLWNVILEQEIDIAVRVKAAICLMQHRAG
jgi:hypothetical protein